LLRGAFDALELRELFGVEENRVRIEAAQKAGDRAFVKGFFRKNGIGGFALQDGIGVDETFDLGFEVIRGDCRNEQKQQRCQAGIHQSGQTEAASTTTSGNSLGRIWPSRMVETVRSLFCSSWSTSIVRP